MVYNDVCVILKHVMYISRTLIILIVAITVSSPTNVFGKSSRSDGSYDRDLYEYCRDRARDLSGYEGSQPTRYKRGGALKGALIGAGDAAALSWITGGDKKERKKAAKRGAALGFLIGAIKQSESNKKNREANEKRRLFKQELDECMNR